MTAIVATAAYLLPTSGFPSIMRLSAFLPNVDVKGPDFTPLPFLNDAHIPDFLSFSTQSLAVSTTTSTSTLPSSGKVFEPVLPDTSTMVGFVSIAILSALCVFVWSNQVVPVSRTNLAIAKKSGPLKDYLDELREGGNSTDAGRDGKEFERWLFTDWLQKPASKGGRQKEPAIPVLKNAKWNSGDNPVLVASTLIFVGVLLTAAVEKLATFK